MNAANERTLGSFVGGIVFFTLAARAASAHDILLRAVHLGSRDGEALLRSAGLDKHGGDAFATVGIVKLLPQFGIRNSS